MNEVDHLIVRHVIDAFPLSPDDRDRLGDASELGVLAVALSGQPDLAELLEDAGGMEGTFAPLCRLAIDRADVGDAIDRAIDDGSETILHNLVRMGIPWSHPSIADRLDARTQTYPAAWLLAETDPEPLGRWLATTQNADAALEALRAVAILGVEEFFGVAEELRASASDEGADAWVRKLDGVLATTVPQRWARGVLGGDYDTGWLADSRAVADYLSAVGLNSWTGVVSLIDGVDDDAFEFAASLAIAASGPVDPELDPAPFQALLAGEIEADDPSLPAGSLTMARALGSDDDEWLNLYSFVRANEILLRLDEPTAGAPGLPLSGNALGDGAADDAAALLEVADDLDADAEVSTVRTLVDLGFLYAANPDADALRPLVEQAASLRGHPNLAIAEAARRVGDFEVDVAVRADAANHIDMSATLAVDDLLFDGSDDAILALGNLFAHGVVSRVDLYASAALDAMASR